MMAELGERVEADRRLPQILVDELTAAHVFQMYQPRSIGGPEVHPLTGFAVCEELARVDGSVGWCAQVSAAVTVFLAWLDPQGLTEMVAMTDGPIHLAGSARPLGTAARDGDDRFRVKGHWNYASGVAHANWFLATAFLDETQHEHGPRTTRSFLVPVEDGSIVTNWDVMGMRGTGSDDFVLDEVVVPRSRTGARHWVDQRTEPLYHPDLGMVATWAPTAGVAIGLARGAIDALIELGDRTSTGSTKPLRDRPNVQESLAEAEAIAGAARAFCVDAIGDAWLTLVGGIESTDGPDSVELSAAVARAQLAITHAMNEAVRVADLCFHAAGTNAISTGNRLERFLRDAHTAVQHAAGHSIHKRAAGRTLLGSNQGGPGGAGEAGGAATTPFPTTSTAATGKT